jgi:hypothetical protein
MDQVDFENQIDYNFDEILNFNSDFQNEFYDKNFYSPNDSYSSHTKDNDESDLISVRLWGKESQTKDENDFSEDEKSIFNGREKDSVSSIFYYNNNLKKEIFNSTRDLNKKKIFNKNLKDSKQIVEEIYLDLKNKEIILNENEENYIKKLIDIVKLKYLSCGCINCKNCKCKKNTKNKKNNVSNFQKCERCKKCVIEEKNTKFQNPKATNSNRNAHQKLMNFLKKEDIFKKFGFRENCEDIINEKVEYLKNFLEENGFIAFFEEIFDNWGHLNKKYKEFSQFIEKMTKLLSGKKSEDVFESDLKKNTYENYINIEQKFRTFLKDFVKFINQTQKLSKRKNNEIILGRSLLRKYYLLSASTFDNCKKSECSSDSSFEKSSDFLKLSKVLDDSNECYFRKLIFKMFYENNKYVYINNNEFIKDIHQDFLNYNSDVFNSFTNALDHEINNCYNLLEKISDEESFKELFLNFFDLTNYERMIEEAKENQ